jgi:hypothetical protein
LSRLPSPPILYHVAEPVPGLSPADHARVRAVRTGQYRFPRAGEWYLSGTGGDGTAPEAYQAHHNFYVRCQILALVLTDTVQVTTIARYL